MSRPLAFALLTALAIAGCGSPDDDADAGDRAARPSAERTSAGDTSTTGDGAGAHAGHGAGAGAVEATAPAGGADEHTGHEAGTGRAAPADAHAGHQAQAHDGHEARPGEAREPAQAHAGHGAADPASPAAAPLERLLDALLEDPVVARRVRENPELRDGDPRSTPPQAEPSDPRVRLLALVRALMSDTVVQEVIREDPDLRVLERHPRVRQAIDPIEPR